MSTIQAPLGILDAALTTKTIAVRIAPTKLRPSFHRQPRPRSPNQWRTIPAWEMANERKIPIE